MKNIYLIILIFFLLIIFTLKNKKENFQNSNQKYIFFTGGFDSTAILVDSLINTNNVIQPIYISDPNLDSISKIKRNNHLIEMKTMYKIINNLKKDYPEKSNNLKDLKIINTVEYDDKTKNQMMDLYLNKYSYRPVRQYGGMAQVCKNLNINADVGVIKGDDLWEKLTHKHVGNNEFIKNKKRISNYGKNNCKLDLKNCEAYFEVYSRFNFPFLHLTKEEIYEKSIKEKWDKYLDITWSCWFPQNEKPCGRCDMCKGRIIPYKSN
jgi:hypothetical protein